MKKFILILAVLMLAAPAFGDAATITAAQVGSTEEVTITYSAPGKLPRAFALDITVDNGQTIIEDGVTDFFVGECDDVNRGYGIFPASFNRVINADFNNWADVNYTPVADVNDLAGDTQGGEGTGGVTIEMGSLYVDDNSPPTEGVLCSIWVSGDCNVSIAANVGRAGVVFEDGSAPAPLNLIGCHVTPVMECYTGPEYDEWVAVGSPDCWCSSVNCRQCKGDADGASQGWNNYWASTYDLDVMTAAWNKPYAEIAGKTACDIDPNYCGTAAGPIPAICADFDHIPQGWNNYRVSTYDLDILTKAWNLGDGDIADPNYPDCDCP